MYTNVLTVKKKTYGIKKIMHFQKNFIFNYKKKKKLKISKQLNDFADTFHTVSLLLRTKYNGKIKKRITENRKGLIEFISMHSSKFDRCY